MCLDYAVILYFEKLIILVCLKKGVNSTSYNIINSSILQLESSFSWLILNVISLLVLVMFELGIEALIYAAGCLLNCNRNNLHQILPLCY